MGYQMVTWPMTSRECINWIVHCFSSPPKQYRLYRTRFLQVERLNQQYQSTEGKTTKENNADNTKKHKIHIVTYAYTYKIVDK